MKKIFFLLALLLVGCAPATVDPNQTRSLPTKDWSGYQPNVEAFELSEQCPGGCWLGIKPGVTTGEEAQALLGASDQINHEKTLVTETGIQVKWFTEKKKELDSSVYMRLDQGIVQSISFDRLAPFALQHLLGVFGEPFGINIDMNIYGEVMEMPYSIYYPSQKMLISGQSADDGPHANDPLDTMTMNVTYREELFRPWVGYGHLTEYFAGKEFHQHPANP